MMHSLSASPSRRAQRGAGALVAVVLLYVAMAIIVVFTNRNLIFEQKTSANQYRATMALEAAEAGLEWATTMLNKSGRITAQCVDAGAGSGVRFRDKYMSYDSAQRRWQLNPGFGPVVAACVTSQSATDTDWTCSCPSGTLPPAPPAVPNVVAPSAGGFKPGFAIAFVTNTATRSVDLVSYGCTSVINSVACTGDAAATVRVTLASVSAMSTAPGGPVIARGTATVGGNVGVQNGDPNSAGVTVNAGMGITVGNLSNIISTPGTPPSSTLVGNDESLRNSSEDQMFQTFFGVPKSTWRDSMADAVLSPTAESPNRCSSTCTEDDVSAALARGARKIWVQGNLEMNGNPTLPGTTITNQPWNHPFILIVDGTVELRGDVNMYGVLYSTAINWDNTGGGSALLVGVAISEGSFEANGSHDYFYDPRVVSNLLDIPGAFARVPGSWRDF